MMKVQMNSSGIAFCPKFCPKCTGIILQDKNELKFCFRCGQKFSWDDFAEEELKDNIKS